VRLALTICLLAAAASTQSVEVGKGSIVRHGDIVTNQRGLTLPAGEFTIGEMVDAVANYLCRNYLYDATLLNQRDSFVLQRALTLDALGSEEVLYALLASRNLVSLPLDEGRGVFQIVPLDQAHGAHPMATIPWRRPQDLILRPHFREIVMTAITLHHLDAQQISTTLRSHFSMLRTWQPGAPMVTLFGKQSLLLHGYADQLTQVLAALRELDRMAAPVKQPEPASNADLLLRLEALEQEVRELRRQLSK
jgi:hypothetical protein